MTREGEGRVGRHQRPIFRRRIAIEFLSDVCVFQVLLEVGRIFWCVSLVSLKTGTDPIPAAVSRSRPLSFWSIMLEYHVSHNDVKLI